MKYFIIAGEASGDLHASALMREIRKLDSSAEFQFLGGDLMLAQGGHLVKHYRHMAFMGFWEVFKNLLSVIRNMKDCKAAITSFMPDVLILVDYPSFNLRIARFVKNTTSIPTHYYISPKIWAWKEGRIKEIKRYVDKLYTIFPFETSFYARHNYAVEYVGNPTVDSVCLRPNQSETIDEFCNQHQLPQKPIIALLAGSRKQEIAGCLPRILQAASRFTNYQMVIAGAPGIDPSYYTALLKNDEVKIVFGHTYELLQQAQAAIVNSGTATLETALIGTPQVVVYRVRFARIAYAIKDLFIKVKFFSLVNLVAEKEVVKELVAHYFTVDNVANELELLLNNKTYRQKMLDEYARILKALGNTGTAERTAKSIFKAIQ